MPWLISIGYAMDQNYIPPPRMSQPGATSSTAAYAQPISSSPALYQSRSIPTADPSFRRHSDLHSSNDPYRRISSSYDSTSSGDYTMAPVQTIPSIGGLTHSPQPSPHMGSTSSAMMPQFQTSASRYDRLILDTRPS